MNKKINRNIKKFRLIPKSLYKSFVAQLPICTVDIIFFNKNKNKILLFKRSNLPLKNIYFSPGGKMLKNESFEKSAIRLAKSELGLNINTKRLIFAGVANEIHSNSIYPNINYHSLNIYFGYEYDKLKIILDEQHSDAKWFSINSNKLHPLIKEKIKFLTND